MIRDTRDISFFILLSSADTRESRLVAFTVRWTVTLATEDEEHAATGDDYGGRKRWGWEREWGEEWRIWARISFELGQGVDIEKEEDAGANMTAFAKAVRWPSFLLSSETLYADRHLVVPSIRPRRTSRSWSSLRWIIRSLMQQPSPHGIGRDPSLLIAPALGTMHYSRRASPLNARPRISHTPRRSPMFFFSFGRKHEPGWR
jgi:hypothetical protein